MPDPLDFDAAAAEVVPTITGNDEPDANPFDEAAAQVAGARRQILATSMRLAKQANPDTRAQALQLAKAARLPIDMVESNLDGVAATVRREIDPDTLRRDHPDLADWLSHPDRAAIASDDLPSLRQIDVAARALRGDDPTGVLPPGYLFQGDKIIRPIGDGALADQFDGLEDLAKHLEQTGDRDLVREVQAKLNADRYAQDYGWAGNLMAGAAQSIQNTQRAIGTRTEYDRAGDEVIEASVTNAPGWFGDVQRGVGGLVADAPLMLAGAPVARGVEALARLTRARAAVSTVVGRTAARRLATGAQVAGAAQPLAIREGLAESDEHGAADGALAWLVESAVPGAFGRTGVERIIVPGASDVATQGWRGAVKRLLTDAGLEGSEEAVTEWAHAVREVATGADPTALDPDKLWRRLTVAGAVGGVAGGAFSLPATIAEKFAQDGEEARRASVHAERLDRLVDLLAESKTNGRAPAEVASGIETTLGQGNRHLFVDAEQFRAAFDDPAAAAAALGVGQEYTTALATGGQVQVPTVALLQRAATDEQFRKLIPNARRAPDARTASEADEFTARAPDALKQLRSEATAATADAQQQTSDTDREVADIERNLVERLSAVSPEQIDRGAIQRQAKIVASAFGALSKRTGKSPSELFTLKLRGDTARLMRGERFDLMDAMIERLRKQEIPSEREAFGPSLADFLREKGLADKALAGELASLKESDRTRKPGERNLIREDGIDLDTAAQLAAERGYIEEATPNALLTALDDEVRGGSATYSTKGGNPEAQAARESLDMLADAIREAGADINASNQEIRKALADLEERAGSQSMNQGAAVVSPKGTSLDVDALLRQWRKATGDRTPIGGIEAWNRLAEESAAIDSERGVELDQPGKDKDRRGSIRFKPGAGLGRTFTISLFRTADVSTFLHESGHLFLELFADLASAPNAPADITADWQRILDWLGAKDHASITEDMHETFARGFERYLMEGKAPASNLREAFARIKAWMVAIYKSVANLRVELTPEIRDVFDRLVAAEDAADQVEAAHGMDALLPREAFPTQEEWDRYASAAQASRQATRDRLEGELLDDYQRRREAEQGAQRAEVRAEVAAEVDALPVYQALAALQRGQLPDGTALPDDLQGLKLDRDDLVNQWGEEVLKRLPGPSDWSINKANRGPRVYANEGGQPVDQFARAWGFPSGDAMIEAMIQADDRASLIDVMTDKRIRERHPDALEDGSLADKANAALATDKRAELFRRELNALGRRTGQTPAPIEVLRQVARDQIAKTEVFKLAPDKFRIAAAKAARRALDAAANQRWDEAYRAKQQEALNLELYRAARDAREASESGRKYLKTFDSLDKRARLGKAGGWEWQVFGPDEGLLGTFADEAEAREAWTQAPQGSTFRRMNGYVEQIDAVLDGFNLRRSSNLSRRRAAQFRSWLAKQEADGEPVAVEPWVREDLGERNWTDLTVEDQAAVVDAVRNIEHLANLKNRLLKSSREREMEKASEEIASTIEQHQPNPRPDGQFDDFLSRAMGKLGGYVDAHRKDSFLARFMDGEIDGGVVHQYIIRPRNEAAGRQETMNAEATAKLAQAFKEWGKKGGALVQAIPGTKLRMTLEQRIALALNWGNPQGRQRVMAYLERSNSGAQDAQAVLDSLDAADWKLIRSIWSQIDTHWSDALALEMRTTGVPLERVQALPFVTKQGVQPGGYYPIKYDPEKSRDGKDLQTMAEARERVKAANVNAQTRRSHTKLRAEEVKNLALRFDFGVIGEHLSEVIHDLTHRELTIDQNRLFRNDRVKNAILDRYGQRALNQFITTATDIATGDASARNAAERMLRALRLHTSAATFGFNLTSALMNVTGFLPALTRVGPTYMAQAVAKLFGGGINNGFALATSKSDLMKNRANTFMREVADATRAVQVGGWQGAMQRWGYYPMMQVQRVVDTVTWNAAYEQALAQAERDGKGGREADEWAVSVADQAVIDTQASGRIGDLAGIQRGSGTGGEAAKLLTTFYSYFSAMANLQGSAVARVMRDPQNAGKWARLVGDTLVVWALPAILGNLIRSALAGDDREDRWSAEKLAREQASYGLGMLVGLREASGIVESGMPYSGPAGTRGLAALAKGIGEAFDGDLGKQDAKALANLAGVFTGMPATQINRLIDAIVEDAAQGREGDALRRALFGAPKQ